MNSKSQPNIHLKSFDFYSKLKDDKSIHIRNALKDLVDIHFAKICSDNIDVNYISSYFQDAISKFTKDFAKEWEIEFFTNKELYTAIINGFENILFKLLYSKILILFKDEIINYKHILFVTLKHLGIDDDNNNNEHIEGLTRQIRLFNRLNDYITPKEKMTVITSICYFVNVTYAKYDRVKLTKCLMYIIIHSEVINIKKQLLYCALFRHKTVLTSDDDFYLSVAIQAVDLVIKLNHKNVSMTKEDFDVKTKLEWKNEIQLINEDDAMANLGNIENVSHIPVEDLYRKYCLVDSNNIPISKYENLRNDMKIVLKLIESSKIIYE